MSQRWLFKEEPSKYSFDDLSRDGRTVWDGVRNNLALQHLRKVRQGDEIFFYHTGKDKAVVGTMVAKGDPYPDPAAENKRFVVVDVEVGAGLKRPVALKELKQDPAFEGSELVRIPRLSVMPVTAAQWRAVMRLARGPRRDS
jgi:predicted RNA-binding protein with PUA-like domain